MTKNIFQYCINEHIFSRMNAHIWRHIHAQIWRRIDALSCRHIDAQIWSQMNAHIKIIQIRTIEIIKEPIKIRYQPMRTI